MFSITEIFDVAQRLEKNGETAYRKSSELAANPKLEKVLVFLADEETKHAQWILELKKTFEKGERNPILEEMSLSLIQDFIGDQTFSLKDVDFSVIKSQKDWIRIFIEFEKDTILFYEMLKPFVLETESSKILDLIIQEENNHIKKLNEFDLF